MASAVGNFPSALRGYDRTAVDDYVRTLEASVVQSRRHAAQLEHQVSSLQDQLTALQNGKGAGSGEVDYSNLGGRTNDILRLAQDQARELVANATLEAEKLKESARREADAVRSSAAREGNAIKTGGTAEIDQLRQKLQSEVQAQVDKSKAEAEALLAAARRQADALRREADHEAGAAREKAALDAENLRRAAEREVAEERQKIAVEREQAVNQLQAVHEEAQQKTAALLAEATKHHGESTERLEADIAEAARIRSEAIAEAEKTKLAAVEESEARINTAKKQASAISERTQQEFAWRKQQLKRETDLLHRRKQAVLSQLASLSALAEQTASAFPDLEDPSEPDGESGDQTVLRPEGLPPAVPDDAESTATDESGAGSESDLEVDGDATVFVSASDLPAGTEHLSAKDKGKGK